MKHRLRHSLVPAVAALAALTLTGCGLGEKAAQEAGDKIVEKAIESDSNGQDVEVDSSDGQVKVETEDGDFTYGVGVDLPEEFPDDVPLPQGDYSVTSAITSGNNVMVTLSLEDIDFDAEKAHLESGFESAGYEVDNATDALGSNSKMVLFEAKKAGRAVAFVLTADATGFATVTYTIEEE